MVEMFVLRITSEIRNLSSSIGSMSIYSAVYCMHAYNVLLRKSDDLFFR